MSNNISRHPLQTPKEITWCGHIKLEIISWSVGYSEFQFRLNGQHVRRAWNFCPICGAKRKFYFNKKSHKWEPKPKIGAERKG